MWLWVPDSAWCECKKCKSRAIELRKRLLESEQQEAKEFRDYQVSMTDWDTSAKKDEKQETSNKKKKIKKSSTAKKNSSNLTK